MPNISTVHGAKPQAKRIAKRRVSAPSASC